MVSKYCRLSSPRSDLIIKTHPHAEIIWWGSALKHFSPDDCASLKDRLRMVVWILIRH